MIKLDLSKSARQMASGLAITTSLLIANCAEAQTYQPASANAPLMPARNAFKTLDQVTTGSVPMLTKVYAVSTSPLSGGFLVRNGKKGYLERSVSAADFQRDGQYWVELGIIPFPANRIIELAGSNKDHGTASLKLVPLTNDERQTDHSARLKAQGRLVFKDDFNTLDAADGIKNTLWTTGAWLGKRSHPSSPDALYSDASFSKQMGVQDRLTPFSINDGVLAIRAGKIPGEVLGRVRTILGRSPNEPAADPNALKYFSGSLWSTTSWSQTYGYFEMRAKLPKGEGFWPAFWLTPTRGWPPEIDILEAVYHEDSGKGVNDVHAGVHYKRKAPNGDPVPPRLTMSTFAPVDDLHAPGADMYSAFHTYSADWTPDWITFYFDGRIIFKLANPRHMHQPMQIVANLQVGSKKPEANWSSDLVNEAVLSESMDIDYIASYVPAYTYSAASADLSGQVLAQNPRLGFAGSEMSGAAGNEKFETGSGVDFITTGAGADTIRVVSMGDAHKIINDFDPLSGDRLILEGFPQKDIVNFQNNARQIGNDVWLMLPTNQFEPQTIILKNFTLARLTSGAVSFVGTATTGKAPIR